MANANGFAPLVLETTDEQMTFLGEVLNAELQDGGGTMFIAFQSQFLSDRMPRELVLTFAVASGVSEARWLRYMNEDRRKTLAFTACRILTGKYLVY